MLESLPKAGKYGFSPGLYDVHAHLADARLRPELPGIILRCQQEMQAVLVNAARFSEWDLVLRLAQSPCVFAALGLHPFFLDEAPADYLALLHQKLLSPALENKIIAIGEIGLDFWHGRENSAKQIAIFSEQLLLAQQLKLPVILHNRKAWPDFFAVLKNLRLSSLRGVCHHFNASPEIARQALEHGLYLSFCGPLTWPESRRLHKLAGLVPLDRILVETDCPDLPPQSSRGGQSRPWMVAEIMDKIAQLQNIPKQKLAAQIASNWTSLFDSTCKAPSSELL